LLLPSKGSHPISRDGRDRFTALQRAVDENQDAFEQYCKAISR
jgi:hypothetical protein